MLAIACQVGLPAGTAAFRPATASRSPSHGTGTEWNSAVGHGYLARAVLDHRAEQELGRGPVGGLAVSLWKE